MIIEKVFRKSDAVIISKLLKKQVVLEAAIRHETGKMNKILEAFNAGKAVDVSTIARKLMAADKKAERLIARLVQNRILINNILSYDKS